MTEESQKIQKYIIKSTPYGELQQVIRDLEKLSPLDPSSPIVMQGLQDYHEDHLSLITIQPQIYFPLMSVSRQQPGRYVDQLARKIYTVDYFKGELASSEDYNPELIDSVEELLQSLSAATAKYTSTYYREPCASNVFMELSEDSLAVHVGITSKNVQLSNFVTGEWVSRWVVRKGNIQGTVAIRAHFFESGNVQFHQRKNINKEFAFTEDMSENARNIVKVIEHCQGEIQSNLNDLYEEMPTGFFKHLRRVVPFTKTKMVWNINAIKMNRNLLGINK